MHTKPLPLGIQTFEHLISGGCTYVDKTRIIRELLRHPKGMYFLARPRRFGKSLLVTTLKAIFEGKRELFEGLAIAESDYEWQEHPVIHIDMSGKVIENKDDLRVHLHNQTARSARGHGVTLEQESYEDRFAELIERLSERNRVAILIDEYDKPILDNITEPGRCEEVKEALSGFYGVIKSSDQYLRFVLLTGVSKFSKVSVFSKLNNLEDLTMDQDCADLLGYTGSEIEISFDEHLRVATEEMGLSRPEMLEEIRHWYNGYRFSARDVRVYNPVSVMTMLKKREFAEYWFETGTPSFLVKLLKERRYELAKIDGLRVPRRTFAAYEIDNLEPEPLLVQTGYLSIQDYSPQDRTFTLSYPNYEVESAFTSRLLSAYSETTAAIAGSSLFHLVDAVRAGDVEGFLNTLKVFFAGIPYDIQLEHEKYYQSVFHLVFSLLGHEIEAESRTADGRIDAVVQSETEAFVFEFKLYEPKEAALAQIKEKEYHLEDLRAGKPVHLVGVEFDRDKRNIGEWEIETLPPNGPR